MKVLLAKPHSYGKKVGAPIGLGYIASTLLKDGHDVKIIDLMLTEKSKTEGTFKRAIKKMMPDIVGITCNSAERFHSFDLARWTKEIGNIKVVMGGPHVTFTDNETLKNVPCLDIIVRNEGELTMKELCNKLEKRKSIKGVKGISFKDAGGKIHINPQREFISNLDNLPFPARHLLEMNKYDLFLQIPSKPPVANLMTSRGCPFKCNFCSTTIMCGNKIRMRSAKNSVDEMEQVVSDYPFLEGLVIYDDTFTINKKRCIEICKEIKKRKLDFRWGCYSRVDVISKELVKALKSAGCEIVSFGVESGSQKILQLMNKRISPNQIIKAVKTVKSENMIARCTFLHGYPGETIRNLVETYLLMFRAGLTYHEIAIAPRPMLFPGTELFEKMKKLDYLPHDFNWENKFDIPNYRDIPVYSSPFNSFRQRLSGFFRSVMPR